VSARATHLKAVTENVSVTTIERKQMSNKTTFKRIALAVVAALGFGVLASSPSVAAVSAETFTATADKTTIAVGESVTVTVVNEFTSSASDTTTIVVDSSTTGTGAIQGIYYVAQSDTVNSVISNANFGAGIATTTPESFTAAAGAARFNRISQKILLQNFSAAGTYYVSVYNYGTDPAVARKSVNLTITVTRPTIDGVRTYISSDQVTAYAARTGFKASTDSGIAVSAGVLNNNTAVGYMFLTGLSAGDTYISTTAGTGNVCSAQTLGYCSFTVEMTGAGALSIDGNSTRATSVTARSYNGATFSNAAETITIVNTGQVGVGTITVKNSAGTVLTTKTVTFNGTPASATLFFSDTNVAIGQSGTNLARAVVLDSAGRQLKDGTVFLYSSDTKVAGTVPSSETAIVNTNSMTYDATLNRHVGNVTITDTGVATFVIRDSNTVTRSTWASTGNDLTVHGTKAAAFTVAFDKATYAPGDLAIVTISGTDLAKRVLPTVSGGITSAMTVVTTPALTYTTTASKAGTSGTTVTDTSFTGYLDSGVETRVVVMPSFGGNVSYDVTYTPANETVPVIVSAKAVVADPTAEAAEAAVDAAQEATDAAIAATDAAILAQEAADEAASAAIAAQETAQAAVDAVTALSAEVTKLVAQLATLQKLLNRVAKRVGVKL
jgi:hypothetical protein